MKEKFTISDFKFYLIVMGLMTLVLLILRPLWGLVALIIFGYAIYYSRQQMEDLNRKIINRVESLSSDFDKTTEHAIFNMPFPLVITDREGKVIWYNSPFLKLLNRGTIMDLMIYDVIPEFKSIDYENIREYNIFDIRIQEAMFKVYGNVIDTSASSSEHDELFMFYWVDQSEFAELAKRYDNAKPVVALVEIDNYSEIMDGLSSSTKPMMIAEIDGIINRYFHTQKALVRKFQENKYLVVLNKESTEFIREARFNILDLIREIDFDNNIPMTLSIGISSPGLPYMDAYKEAGTCLDIALGRGGDQAVIRTEDNYEFFGGKSKAVERRNKVKARVLGMALQQLIDKAGEIYIMGHTNPDMDAIGSAIGLLRAIENRDKVGHLVLEGSNPSIDILIKRMREEAPERYKQIITGQDAYNNLENLDLVILVDNHKPSFSIYPPLLEKAKNVVVIDHHRRGKEFVKEPVLTYVEPYASSTSELVTEMLTYMDSDLNFTPFEADALMSGIVVDTKNFTFQTGVRTFEAASVLKRAGADMSKVRMLFEDDFDTIMLRAQVVHEAEIFHDNIAISRLTEEAPNAVLVSAQAADELLEIHGIKASFVLTKLDEAIHISGRSFGDISVQLILETLGGGGHLSMAGAQLKDVTIAEAEDQLKEAIIKYFEDNKKGEEE